MGMKCVFQGPYCNVEDRLDFVMNQVKLKSQIHSGKCCFWTKTIGRQWLRSESGFSHDSSIAVSLGSNKKFWETNDWPSTLLLLKHHIAYKKNFWNLNLASNLFFAKLITSHIDDREIPIMHRLFLGGAPPSDGSLSLRGVERNSVGGTKLLIPMNLPLRSTLCESAGGKNRLNWTTEVRLDLATLVGSRWKERIHQLPRIQTLSKWIMPFAFFDAGYLSSSLKWNRSAIAANSAMSAGFGTRAQLAENSYLEFSGAIPLMQGRYEPQWHVGPSFVLRWKST
eukprot:Gregarina_sp_Poly_1__5711@NODE_2_length_28028_cov_167_134223_g1_i0_p9_GENE_NODE_2_length_28028_cov_167_134223_g1_i0NODE_2_length_28028_cov_167_134223_g1_i0_p9_ORF_typecomplete_len282_score28_03Bac_surface_Ag/PF01103_23/8_7e09ShlB/PF03865_13/0_14_NODE_2_length_28028_cov_167_134223_g1_i01511815963